MLTRHFPRRILYVYEKSHLSVITPSSPVVGDGSDATESLHFRLSLYSCTYTYIYIYQVGDPSGVFCFPSIADDRIPPAAECVSSDLGQGSSRFPRRYQLRRTDRAKNRGPIIVMWYIMIADFYSKHELSPSARDI